MTFEDTVEFYLTWCALQWHQSTYSVAVEYGSMAVEHANMLWNNTDILCEEKSLSDRNHLLVSLPLKYF